MRIHHTKNKGDLGLMKAMCSLAEQGYYVLLPQSEHSEFDVVGYKNGKFTKVQVKYRAAKNGAILIDKQSCWNDRSGHHKVSYTDIDVFCVYCPETDECYFVPKSELETNVTAFKLRITQSKNNQVKKVRYACDYVKMPP